MHYRKLGRTNLEVSSLGYGLMRLPLCGGDASVEEAAGLIACGLDAGINVFDVGTFYGGGRCEETLGLAFRSRTGQKVIRSGKNSSHQQRQGDWTGQMISSMERMGVEQFDVYYIHHLGFAEWQQWFVGKGIVDEVVRAREQGLYRFLGFSTHDKPEGVRRLIDTGLFDCVMLPYNLIKPEIAGVMAYAHAKGLGVTIMNPLAGGLLKDGIFQDDLFGSHFPGVAVTDLALQYVLSNPHVSCAMSGMRSHAEIRRNCEISEMETLGKSDLEQIDRLVREHMTQREIYCTACGYCLPCPQGIPIPDVLQILNRNALFGGDGMFVREYALLEHNAECCIDCGICEKRCPNGLPISSHMKEARTKFS